MLDLLLPRRELAALAPSSARVARALRIWVILSKTGRCPIQAVADRIGSLRAAAHLHLLLEEIGAAWPEPFAVSPPCCGRLSHDEALVIDMIEIAGTGDRPAFDRLLCEMLPEGERERLFLSSSVLAGAMR